MSGNYPCLEARIAGGAFVHEGWGDLCDTRIIALCDSDFTATLLAKALALRADERQRYIVTDARGGSQQIWSKPRLEEEAKKACAA